MRDGFSVDLVTRDMNVAVAALSSSYSPYALTVLGSKDAFAARHVCGSLVDMSAHFLSYGADVRADVAPIRKFVLLSQVLEGRYRISSDEGVRELGPGDTVALDPHTRYVMDFLDGCRMLQLRIDRGAWTRANSKLGVPDPRPTRYAISQQPTREMELRRRTIFEVVVEKAIPQDWGNQSPLLARQLMQLCVAALLEAPVYTDPSPMTSASSRTVRLAMEYLAENAQRAIGLTDIAQAVSLSPRALQEAFRKELGTSPLGALREIRLLNAHSDLQRYGPRDTTVTDVATNWGFVNLGRFAQEYRQRFGQSPSEVLRS